MDELTESPPVPRISTGYRLLYKHLRASRAVIRFLRYASPEWTHDQDYDGGALNSVYCMTCDGGGQLTLGGRPSRHKGAWVGHREGCWWRGLPSWVRNYETSYSAEIKV